MLTLHGLVVGILIFIPGLMSAEIPFNFMMSWSVTPGYFLEIAHKLSPGFTVYQTNAPELVVLGFGAEAFGVLGVGLGGLIEGDFDLGTYKVSLSPALILVDFSPFQAIN